MSEERCVIMGGGVGGLFTGALLARNGWRVTVLEKNAIIGGGLQCFHRGPASFGTGMHIVGGFQQGGQLHALCQYLGIFDQLRLCPVDGRVASEVHFLLEHATYVLPQGREAYEQSLISLFPSEEEGIRRYVEALYLLAAEEPLFKLRAGVPEHSDMAYWSVTRLVAHFLSSPLLRSLVTWAAPLLGGKVETVPAYAFALVSVSFLEGMWQFEGGSQQLADSLANVIRQRQGQVLTSCEVTGIEIRDGLVQYVETSTGERYVAEKYVCSLHPCSLLAMTDSRLFTTSFRSRMSEAADSYSCAKLFLHLKPGVMSYLNHPLYIYRQVSDVWNLDGGDKGQWPQGLMMVTPPSPQQDAWASTVEALSPMPYSWVQPWEESVSGHRAESYYQWKSVCEQRIMAMLTELFPPLREGIVRAEVASPLTFRDYTGSRSGSMYGLVKDCEHPMMAQLSVNTKVHNLFLTGQNVNLHGLCGVALTAVATSEALLGENAITKQLLETK